MVAVEGNEDDPAVVPSKEVGVREDTEKSESELGTGEDKVGSSGGSESGDDEEDDGGDD
jgi:hypothetical protein